MPSKCEKCGDKDNYNFALNIGLCNSCIAKTLNELKAENEQLKGEKPLPYGYWSECPKLAQRVMERIIETNAELQAENERLSEALERIQTWSKAYPLEVFPKPDLKKAAEVLKDAGMTLGAISADNMCHVLNGIKDIVSQALKEKRSE